MGERVVEVEGSQHSDGQGDDVSRGQSSTTGRDGRVAEWVDGMGDLGDCGGVERGGISIGSGGFAGECRKLESWRSAAVGVKADGLVVIPAVGGNEGEKGKEMGSWRGRGWRCCDLTAAAAAA